MVYEQHFPRYLKAMVGNLKALNLGEYSVGSKWYFPFTLSYWFSKSQDEENYKLLEDHDESPSIISTCQVYFLIKF